jgi:subfamily B ATP-binding cassette protein HlyB/CyaB
MDSSDVRNGHDAGIAAFVLLLRFHEFAVDPGQIRHRYANASFGIDEILHCAKEFKLKARALHGDWSSLLRIPLPALVECRDGSFIVLGKIVGEKALIQDPRIGRPQLVSQAEFEARWSGRLVLVTRRASLSDLKRQFDVRARASQRSPSWCNAFTSPRAAGC